MNIQKKEPMKQAYCNAISACHVPIQHWNDVKFWKLHVTSRDIVIIMLGLSLKLFYYDLMGRLIRLLSRHLYTTCKQA